MVSVLSKRGGEREREGGREGGGGGSGEDRQRELSLICVHEV